MPDALPLPYPAPMTDLMWTALVCFALLLPAALIVLAMDLYVRRGGLFGRPDDDSLGADPNEPE